MKYSKPLSWTIMTYVIMTFAVFGQPDSYNGNDYHSFDMNEIKLPWEIVTTKPLTLVKSENSEYKDFAKKYGEWTFVVNTHSRTINRAYGNPIKLLSAEKLTKNNIVPAANAFISENSGIFGIDPAQLALSRANEVNGRWYIGYKQYYRGLEVLLSEVELRIFNNANLSNFSLEYYRDINIDVNSTSVTPDEASELATVGLVFNPQTDESITDGKLFILPYFKHGKTEYRLVHKVNVNTSEPFARYFCYVDANSGEILWRQNTVINAGKVKTHGTIKPRFGQDPLTDSPFAGMDITIGQAIKTTNANGEAQYFTDDSVDVNAKFTGPWAKVTLASGSPRPTANYTTRIKGDGDVEILWDDNNSHLAERNLFFHANWVHDYIKGIDTTLKVMDFQLAVSVDFKGNSPNAYSSGQTIGYISAGAAGTRFHECASILYHEYGHSVNGLLYKDEGATNGLINLSCNEGMADLFSAVIQDEPRMGVGAWVGDSNKVIRNLDNKLVYPEDIQADGHHNGMILGGAFWDLRKMTDLDYVRRLSHFVKYGLPDDANVGVAFSEWFIETLNTDDDDGNLLNGTPHLFEIVKSFNNHQIGTNLMLQLGFSHNQLPNTLETIQPYEVNFTLTSAGIAGSNPDSVCVYWSVDNFNTVNISLAEPTGIGTGFYKAMIPSQNAGTIVQYYMHAYEPVSKSAINFYKAFDSKKPFRFLVGFKSVLVENFETNSNWSAAAGPSDDATRGKWELGIPNQIDMSLYGYGVLQPGKDHSETGLNCWVTGAKGNMTQYMQYMPNGQTTLTTSDYQIKGYVLPIIKYYKWFFNMYGMGYPGYETFWQTNISFDGGLNWQVIERTKEPTRQWEEQFILLYSILPEGADSFRLRFVFDVPKYQNNPYSFNEGLIDDFEILTIDETLVGVEESASGISLSPNPATDYIEITISDRGINPSAGDIHIFDILGTEISTLTPALSLKGEGVRIDVSSLPPGVYFVRIADVVRKFVKM
jgi:Zn-dependent metalloprotease